MTTRLLVVLLVLQAAGLAWRWCAYEPITPAPPPSPPPAASPAADTTATTAAWAALRAFEVEWDAGRTDPFDPRRQNGPRKPPRDNWHPVPPRQTLEKMALQDPIVSRGDWKHKRFNLRKEYAAFFIAERIAPEQSAKVLDLLADLATGQRLAKAEAYDAGDPELGPAVQRGVEEDIQREIAALLGAEQTSKLAHYRESIPVRRDFDVALAELRGLRAEPTENAKELLLEVLVSARSSGGDTAYDIAKVLRESAAALTPPQLQIVEELLRRKAPPPASP